MIEDTLEASGKKVGSKSKGYKENRIKTQKYKGKRKKERIQ